MPLLLDAAPSASTVVGRDRGTGITIGLVNNMPDTAWEATERQFLALVRATAGTVPVHVKLFSITDLPRADHVRRELSERYRGLSELWSTRLDGLIVTGTEPRAANLKDEPYWTALAELVDWARQNTDSTIWSCLAAHVAVLQADGIERCPLADKQFGVFDFDVLSADPMTKGAGPKLPVPHSRWNDLPEQALAACGYRILTRSAAAGVDMFAAPERNGHSFFLFLQGHPEYEAGTLLREYRRDIGRFLRGEQERYPTMPQGYFNGEASVIASAFREHAVGERRHDLIADFPMRALEGGLGVRWHRAAVGFYERWLDYLKERKAERRSPAVPLQPAARRNWPGVIRPAAAGQAQK
jgi:homoserine O-succinyltransferase/O-acetyltransferase